MFTVFNPIEIERMSISNDFSLEKIQNLSRRFNIDPELASSEWIETVTLITESPDWCSYKDTQSRDFWSHYLSADDIVTKPTIVKLVKIVLSLPTGSSDAERAFSILNHVRHKRRSKLARASIESSIRVRMNGPKKLEEFPAVKYAKLWTEKHLGSHDPRAATLADYSPEWGT